MHETCPQPLIGPLLLGLRELGIDLVALVERAGIEGFSSRDLDHQISVEEGLALLRTAAEMVRHEESGLGRHDVTARNSDDFLQCVRAAVVAALQRGKASLPAVARAVHISPRTLQRRLAAHGTRLDLISQEVRAQLAKEYLIRPDLATIDVALMIGFSDDRAFRRAFRRWWNMSPADYRERERTVRRADQTPSLDRSSTDEHMVSSSYGPASGGEAIAVALSNLASHVPMPPSLPSVIP